MNITLLTKISRYAQIILGLVFIFAALSKGIDPIRFGRQIEILLGIWGNAGSTVWITWAFMTGFLVLMIEFLLGIMLITKYKLRLAGVSSILLLLFFAIIITWEWSSGKNESCGCFGVLIERSHLTALIEDIFFIILAVIACLGSDTYSYVKTKVFAILVIVCLIWIVFFSIFPMKSAVIRKGSTWNLSSIKAGVFDRQVSLIWLFNPECSECTAETEKINKLASNYVLPRLYGVTDATLGRLHEYSLDFEPSFPIIRISKDDYKKIFLPDGSLILINDNCVKKIWRPKLIHTDAGDIVSLIQK
ncbi:hypothetical protein K9N50_10960 [bacterium]|nr:hypothetical protein [bacterium]